MLEVAVRDPRVIRIAITQDMLKSILHNDIMHGLIWLPKPIICREHKAAKEDNMDSICKSDNGAGSSDKNLSAKKPHLHSNF